MAAPVFTRQRHGEGDQREQGAELVWVGEVRGADESRVDQPSTQEIRSLKLRRPAGFPAVATQRRRTGAL